jgi:hypothetical protein
MNVVFKLRKKHTIVIKTTINILQYNIIYVKNLCAKQLQYITLFIKQQY